MRLRRARLPDVSSSLVNGSWWHAFDKRRIIWPWPVMSIVLCCPTMVSRRPPVIKLACRRNIGADSLELSSGRVLRGAIMFSSSMLMGKLARLRASMVGRDGSCLASLTTRRGVFSNG